MIELGQSNGLIIKEGAATVNPDMPTRPRGPANEGLSTEPRWEIQNLSSLSDLYNRRCTGSPTAILDGAGVLVGVTLAQCNRKDTESMVGETSSDSLRVSFYFP